jgi:hypothetical protein
MKTVRSKAMTAKLPPELLEPIFPHTVTGVLRTLDTQDRSS